MVERLGHLFRLLMLSCEPISGCAAAQGLPGDNRALQIESDSTSSDDSFFSGGRQTVSKARASQPNWSSPLVTTTALLENRLRFDTDWLHAGNNTSTVVLDGGKGLDLIVGETSEIQIAAPPYITRRSQKADSEVTGFGDWPFFRIEERLASSPQDQANYVLSALLQVQAPTRNHSFSNETWTFSPMLGFGKGWGDFDIQGMITASLPTANVATLGHSLQTNIAFQYRVWNVLWPEFEVSWTYFPDGLRAGLHQLYLTTGLVIGRFMVTEHLRITTGVGYEFAVAPPYLAKPLAPAFDHGWLLTTRFNFE